MFQELIKYKEQHGDCLVPVRYTDDSKKPALGRWVNKQRIRHRKNHMISKRKRLSYKET
jgi:hypothetical protein